MTHGVVISALLIASGAAYYWGDLSMIPAPSALNDFLKGLAYHEVGFLLLAVPVIYASVVFRFKGAVATSLIASAIIIPHAFQFTSYPDPFFRLFSFASISMLLGGLIGILLDSREQLRAEHSRLEQFVTETLNSQETERKHVARELHDETAQALVDVLHQIDEVRDDSDGGQFRTSQLDALRVSIEDVLEGTRRLMLGLRPPHLDELGLEPSLKWLCQQVSEESETKVTFSVDGILPKLPRATELAIYRMTQEALTNARRYADAEHIEVRVRRNDGRVRVEVEDDGIGFAVRPLETLARQGKFGLIGLTERARIVGGTVQIRSTEGQGTSIALEVDTESSLNGKPKTNRAILPFIQKLKTME